MVSAPMSPFTLAIASGGRSLCDDERNVNLALVSPVCVADLSASLTDLGQWTSVFGEKANASATATAGFEQAMSNLGNVGFAFGGGCFYGHGVRVSGGRATFLAMYHYDRDAL